MVKFLLYTVVFMTAINYCLAQRYCLRDYDLQPGVCKPISKCSRIIPDLMKGIQPQFCALEQDTQTYCCPDESSNDLYNSRVDSSLRVSAQKCNEYSLLTHKRVPFIPLTLFPQKEEINTSECDYTTSLIIGGEEANVGEFPHMAAIGWTSSNGVVNFECGGSIISEKFILTAAHCNQLHGIPPDTIRIGDHDLIDEHESIYPQNLRIAKIITHPKYKRPSKYYDIALIMVSENIKFNKFSSPACLWQSDNINYTKVIASGWGLTKYLGEKSNKLMKVSLDVIENDECRQYYDPEPRLYSDGLIDSQLCAGVLAGGKDTCQGDSGGPLQVTTTNNACMFHIVGVASFGKFCAQENSPGIYTRVSSYLDWIESNVWS